MSGGWLDAFALVSSIHQDEFEQAYVEAVGPGDSSMMHHRLVRARVPDPHQDGLLLLALKDDFGQRCMVGPGRYWFPAEDWRGVHDIALYHGIRMRVVPSLLYRLDFRRRSALDALRAALLRQAPTFGPTYPRFVAA